MLNLSFNESFYQDFLYRDLPITNGEIKYDLKYADKCDCIIDIDTPYNLFDCSEINRSVTLSYLMSVIDEKAWNDFCSKVSNVDYLVIIDDIILVNDELDKYKMMFLKVYQFNLSKFCSETFIYIDKNSILR